VATTGQALPCSLKRRAAKSCLRSHSHLCEALRSAFNVLNNRPGCRLVPIVTEPSAPDIGLLGAIPMKHSSLKVERTARTPYRTRDEPRADVFDYLECFHNPKVTRGWAISARWT
jgi:hypothetical protein